MKFLSPKTVESRAIVRDMNLKIPAAQEFVHCFVFSHFRHKYVDVA